MSIPIYFYFYDANGNYLTTRSIFTVSYGAPDRVNNLTKISEELQYYRAADYRTFVHEAARYMVPTNISDYMFDIHNPKLIMPNRFKKSDSERYVV